jgi:hypothetical protein
VIRVVLDLLPLVDHVPIAVFIRGVLKRFLRVARWRCTRVEWHDAKPENVKEDKA